MPERQPPTRRRLPHAALAAAAGLAALWPLGQVLNLHSDELRALQAERAALDPVAQALQVHRSLLSHEQTAARVLSGRHALEPERRLRQAEVDGAIWQLKGTLSAGLWERALDEAQALELDWRKLARLCLLRQLEARDSHDSHRQLIEQLILVTDLVAAHAEADPSLATRTAGFRVLTAPRAAFDEQSLRAELAQLDQALSRLQAQTTLLDERAQRARSARQQQAAGLGLLALSLAAAALWVRRARMGDPARPKNPGGGADGVRSGHGRRTTDATARTDATQQLMTALRQGELLSEVMPPPPAPPGP